MEDLLQRDLGANLLSLAIILGWLGISLVLLRILALLMKTILETIFKGPG